METDKKEQIIYYGTGIKTLRGVSDALGGLGILGSIIIVIVGFSESMPGLVGAGIALALFSIFLHAVGKVLATIAEIKLKEDQSKTNIILK